MPSFSRSPIARVAGPRISKRVSPSKSSCLDLRRPVNSRLSHRTFSTSKPCSYFRSPILLVSSSNPAQFSTAPISSASSSSASSSSSSASAPTNSRWLSDIKTRLGACMTFGCNEGQEMELAGKIAKTVALEWRGLVAGAEGFWIEDVPGREGGHGKSAWRGREKSETRETRDYVVGSTGGGWGSSAGVGKAGTGVKKATAHIEPASETIQMDVTFESEDVVRAELDGDVVAARRRAKGNSWVEGVRWGDMDSMVSHVNNASYLRYAEISRVHYIRRLARLIPEALTTLPYGSAPHQSPSSLRTSWLSLATPHSIGIIYSKATLSFLFPAKYPDRLTLCHRLADNLPAEGETMDMIPLQVVALSHSKQRNCVKVYEENVVYDYAAGKRVGMPDWMVGVLRVAKREEERMRREWLTRRAEVERWLDRLEGWTVKSGRAEDMGK